MATRANRALCGLGLVVLLAACATTPPNSPSVQAVTAVPTLDITNADALCSAVTDHWGQDWSTTIRALEALKTLDTTCTDGIAIDNRLYIAYVAYGALLEQRGRIPDAVEIYQKALEVNRLGSEAASRLRDLNMFTPEPPERCDTNTVMAALASVTDYTPTTGSFVRMTDDGFVLEGEPYPVYGMNYYPRDTPGKRFLTETDVEGIGFELDLLKASGLNTLRIFVRNDVLFSCPGNGAVPIAENLMRLDAFIRAAAAREYKLIIVMNDTPDLSVYPLYDSPTHTTEQFTYLLTRYRNEPAILAWDLRDGGDLDYSIASESQFDRDQVLEWLTQTAALARQTDPNHLITAGWRDDSAATIPIVDFVSFQHFGDSDSLRQRIASLKDQTHKPILLAAVGYSTYEGIDEHMQRDLIYRAFEAVNNNHLAGWVVWTAFDYPLTVTCDTPDCVDTESSVHHFGLWNTSYFPKLATDAVKEITGIE
jgi:tetratricopeptide (TPR) repeat protein